jgi:hypothetical protein
MAEHMSEAALRIDRRPDSRPGHAGGLVAQNRARIPRDGGLEKRGSALGNGPPGRHEISE